MGSLYPSKHELVFVYRLGTAPHLNTVELGRHGRNRTNVWDHASVNSMRAQAAGGLALHPTVTHNANQAAAVPAPALPVMVSQPLQREVDARVGFLGQF
jgi:hypothetical protein